MNLPFQLKWFIVLYTQPLRLFGREVPGWSSDIVRKPSGFFEFFERKCMREKLHEQFHDQLTLKPKFHDQFNPHHDQLAAPAPELGGSPRTPSERLWDSRMEDCLENVTIRNSFLPSNPNQESTASRNRQNWLLSTSGEDLQKPYTV